MQTLTKQDFIVALAPIVGSKKLAAEVYDAIGEMSADALVRGDAVRWNGLGTILPVVRAERAGTGPGGVGYVVPARRSARLKVSGTLRQRLNG